MRCIHYTHYKPYMHYIHDLYIIYTISYVCIVVAGVREQHTQGESEEALGASNLGLVCSHLVYECFWRPLLAISTHSASARDLAQRERPRESKSAAAFQPPTRRQARQSAGGFRPRPRIPTLYIIHALHGIFKTKQIYIYIYIYTHTELRIFHTTNHSLCATIMNVCTKTQCT